MNLKIFPRSGRLSTLKSLGSEIDQQKSISKIIQKAYTNKPVKLTGEEFKKEATKFMVFESAAKDSLTLLRILPELKNKCMEAVQVRQQLLDLNEQVPEDKTEVYGKIMLKLKEISQEEVEKNVLEWSKYQTAVEKYVGEGKMLSDASNKASDFSTLVGKDLQSVVSGYLYLKTSNLLCGLKYSKYFSRSSEPPVEWKVGIASSEQDSTCYDMDECQLGTHDCRGDQNCVNTAGGPPTASDGDSGHSNEGFPARTPVAVENLKRVQV
eukprot:g9572.t1